MDPFYRLGSRLFPELSLFETEKERRAAFWKARGNLNTLICVCVLFGPLIYLSHVLVRFLSGFLSQPLIVAIPLGLLIGFALGFLALWLSRKAIRRRLHRLILEAGIPICIKCGYDLRGQVEPRCPECGTPFNGELLDREEPSAGH